MPEAQIIVIGGGGGSGGDTGGESPPAAGQSSAPVVSATSAPVNPIDDDTALAVIAFWMSDRTLAGMTQFPPQRGRLKSEDMPNVAIKVGYEKREPAASGVPPVWFDYRRVELTVRGLEPDVRQIVGRVRGDGVTAGVFVHGTELVYPSGAQCLAVIPDRDATIEQEDGNKDGKEVWRGTVSFLAESTRVG